MGIDHTLQAIQYEKLNSPKLFKRKDGYHLGKFSNTSFVVFGAERVKRVKRDFFHGYVPLLLRHFLRVRGLGFQLTSALGDLFAVEPSQKAQGGGTPI